MANQLTISNLRFSYGQQEVLRGVDLEMNAGEIHGILGMNGAGKTTLFNNLYARLRPELGTCQWGGAALTTSMIAFLETHNYFYPYLKGREYLQLIAQNQPNFAIDQWNQIFELPLNKLVDDYSTGMKKKLAFLGMLAQDRPILLLDEPFNGVDVESNEKIFQILLRLRDQGKLIILSSHIIQSLTGIANKIHYLQEGQIRQTYLPADFPRLETELKQLISDQIRENLDLLLKN